jgi:hypothetical protein
MRQIIAPIATVLILTGCWMEVANAIELPVCVNKKTSAWRIVANVNKCNAKKENAQLLNTTGPAGPQGEKGEPGPMGPKGDKGGDGQGGISVYDANNQFLGYGTPERFFIPAPINAFAKIMGGNGIYFSTYNPSNNYVTEGEYEHLIGSSNPNYDWLGITTYASTDCSGTSNSTFYDTVNIPPLAVKGIGTATGKYFIYKQKLIERGEKVIVNSFWFPPTSSCRTVDATNESGFPFYTIPATFELIEVTLPFTLPLALPLRYE